MPKTAPSIVAHMVKTTSFTFPEDEYAVILPGLIRDIFHQAGLDAKAAEKEFQRILRYREWLAFSAINKETLGGKPVAAVPKQFIQLVDDFAFDTRESISDIKDYILKNQCLYTPAGVEISLEFALVLFKKAGATAGEIEVLLSFVAAREALRAKLAIQTALFSSTIAVASIPFGNCIIVEDSITHKIYVLDRRRLRDYQKIKDALLENQCLFVKSDGPFSAELLRAFFSSQEVANDGERAQLTTILEETQALWTKALNKKTLFGTHILAIPKKHRSVEGAFVFDAREKPRLLAAVQRMLTEGSFLFSSEEKAVDIAYAKAIAKQIDAAMLRMEFEQRISDFEAIYLRAKNEKTLFGRRIREIPYASIIEVDGYIFDAREKDELIQVVEEILRNKTMFVTVHGVGEIALDFLSAVLKLPKNHLDDGLCSALTRIYVERHALLEGIDQQCTFAGQLISKTPASQLKVESGVVFTLEELGNEDIMLEILKSESLFYNGYKLNAAQVRKFFTLRGATEEQKRKLEYIIAFRSRLCNDAKNEIDQVTLMRVAELPIAEIIRVPAPTKDYPRQAWFFHGPSLIYSIRDKGFFNYQNGTPFAEEQIRFLLKTPVIRDVAMRKIYAVAGLYDQRRRLLDAFSGALPVWLTRFVEDFLLNSKKPTWISARDYARYLESYKQQEDIDDERQVNFPTFHSHLALLLLKDKLDHLQKRDPLTYELLMRYSFSAWVPINRQGSVHIPLLQGKRGITSERRPKEYNHFQALPSIAAWKSEFGCQFQLRLYTFGECFAAAIRTDNCARYESYPFVAFLYAISRDGAFSALCAKDDDTYVDYADPRDWRWFWDLTERFKEYDPEDRFLTALAKARGAYPPLLEEARATIQKLLADFRPTRDADGKQTLFKPDSTTELFGSDELAGLLFVPEIKARFSSYYVTRMVDATNQPRALNLSGRLTLEAAPETGRVAVYYARGTLNEHCFTDEELDELLLADNKLIKDLIALANKEESGGHFIVLTGANGYRALFELNHLEQHLKFCLDSDRKLRLRIPGASAYFSKQDQAEILESSARIKTKFNSVLEGLFISSENDIEGKPKCFDLTTAHLFANQATGDVSLRCKDLNGEDTDLPSSDLLSSTDTRIRAITAKQPSVFEPLSSYPGWSKRLLNITFITRNLAIVADKATRQLQFLIPGTEIPLSAEDQRRLVAQSPALAKRLENYYVSRRNDSRGNPLVYDLSDRKLGVTPEGIVLLQYKRSPGEYCCLPQEVLSDLLTAKDGRLMGILGVAQQFFVFNQYGVRYLLDKNTVRITKSVVSGGVVQYRLNVSGLEQEKLPAQLGAEIERIHKARTAHKTVSSKGALGLSKLSGLFSSPVVGNGDCESSVHRQRPTL